MKRLLLAAVSLLALGALAACDINDADVVSKNISTDADNFRVARRVVLYNGITNEYIQTVEGFCSLGNDDGPQEVSVTCKTPTGYAKSIWKLGDNVTVFAEQLVDVQVSADFYKVTFKPTVIIPNIELNVGN